MSINKTEQKRNKNHKRQKNKRNVNINDKMNMNIIYNTEKVQPSSTRSIQLVYKKTDKKSYENFNIQELNTLEYEMAIIYDKRTYFQYYWSLLKKKHLILFTFLPENDYNLSSLKISLFLLSFSLYFTINGFFFSDDTMHKINENNGAYNIIFQIPQILYSSVISAVINMILKLLSLSEKNILVIKKENNINNAKKISKNIKKCILIKFIIFFKIGNMLLIFFWYFITCFCAVYINTQNILIKDTIISFTLSIIYPFGLNLLPGLFRIPSLKAKNKKYLYQISNFLALI